VSSKKFIIGGLILFITLGFLGYKAFTQSVPYYYTVSELISQGNSTYSEKVRVNGVVTPGTVEEGADGLTITFMLSDSKEQLTVIYRGAVTQTFEDGREIVIEGIYNPGGIFEASSILTRCPSKYVPDPGVK